ncbi:GFA family protein [Devosia rhodophyticola]|uniref:GFA family protein n=1 Tax=Devosia rhodophyticola TaxID=3026423 RepID=A0ABY7YW36_9HYPH|nr:GFA family protein [Devosia rhodophyticola]WDR05446.1 GFA family protein [Devosia rhodophyticola]
MNIQEHPRLDLHATCACGAASLSLSGKILSMFVCSCQDCQRATGSGHACLAMVSKADVTISGFVKSYDATADSGATVARSFCPECGTPMFGKTSRSPDIMLLPVGLFTEDADWFSPNQLIFARSHHDWDFIAPEVEQYPTYPQRRPAP